MSVHSGGRQILIHGMVFVRAHIQFVTNGMLFIVLATPLLALPHSVGLKSVWVMVVAVWLTWAMPMSEVANAWWGTTQMLRIAASQAGTTGGEPWQELVVTLTHIGAGLGLIIAWSLLVVGFVKHPGRGSNGG
jgi:(hydroxyamino)benzene mutase